MSSKNVTLQELSYAIILRNFSRFTTAYGGTNDDYLKNNLLFLQKRYSLRLFQELARNNKLKEEYLSFLINEYLGRLDVVSLLGVTSKENVLEKVLPIAHTVTELSCVTKKDIYFNFLLNVCNRGSSDNNEDSFPVRWSGTSDDLNFVLRELLPLVNVNTAYISCDCDDELLRIVASSRPPPHCIHIYQSEMATEVPTLVYFFIDSSESESNAATDALKFNNITLHFHYGDFAIAGRLRICSELFHSVKKLKIDFCMVDEQDVCSLFPELEDISITCIDTVPVLEIPFSFELSDFFRTRKEKLKHLAIVYGLLSMSALIENCPNLEWLQLETVDYENIDHSVPKALIHLRDVLLLDFDATDNNSKDSLLLLLNSSPNLEKLSFSYCKGCEIVVELLASFRDLELKDLCFHSSDVTIDELLDFIPNCPSLSTLSLSVCRFISAIDITKLKQTVDELSREIKIEFCECKQVNHSEQLIEDQLIPVDNNQMNINLDFQMEVD